MDQGLYLFVTFVILIFAFRMIVRRPKKTDFKLRHDHEVKAETPPDPPPADPKRRRATYGAARARTKPD